MVFPGEMLIKSSIQGASVAFFLNYMIGKAELQSILETTDKKNPSFRYWYYDGKVEKTDPRSADYPLTPLHGLPYGLLHGLLHGLSPVSYTHLTLPTKA